MYTTNFLLPPSSLAACNEPLSSGMYLVSQAAREGGGFDLSEDK